MGLLLNLISPPLDYKLRTAYSSVLIFVLVASTIVSETYLLNDGKALWGDVIIKKYYSSPIEQKWKTHFRSGSWWQLKRTGSREGTLGMDWVREGCVWGVGWGMWWKEGIRENIGREWALKYKLGPNQERPGPYTLKPSYNSPMITLFQIYSAWQLAPILCSPPVLKSFCFYRRKRRSRGRAAKEPRRVASGSLCPQYWKIRLMLKNEHQLTRSFLVYPGRPSQPKDS